MSESLPGPSGPARSAESGHWVKTRGTVTVDVETCKGCELCIPACPPKVLEMSTAVNRKGYRYPELHPGCTGCAACLMVCPDFCFEVFRFNTPHEIQIDVSGATARQGGPGAERGLSGPTRSVESGKEVPA